MPGNSDMCEYFRPILSPQPADALPTQAEQSHPDSWRPCYWMHVMCVAFPWSCQECARCATLTLHHRYKHKHRTTTSLPGATWLGKGQGKLCINESQEQWALHPPDCLQENSGKEFDNFFRYLYIYIFVHEILISAMKKVCSKIYNNVLHTAL